MKLNLLTATEDSVRAGYDCPCGCRPSLAYERAGAPVHDGCCCGNEFAIGPHETRTLEAKAGYRQETTSFGAPWGETIWAEWLIGPSRHDEASLEHNHGHSSEAHVHDKGINHEGRDSTSKVDPVCGMSVEPQTAATKGLGSTYRGRDFYFCGRGCKLEFDEDPDRYLDPSYVPSM